MALTMWNESLRLLEPYQRFVVYGVAPRAGKPGKFDKFPICPSTGGRLRGWQKPESCMPLADAFGVAAQRPGEWGVGFVFHPGDNLYFLDIDGCVADGVWEPAATELLGTLSGAYFEVSTSGSGAHAIFYASDMPAHGTRSTHHGLSLELYSSSRFCALTGQCWQNGWPLIDNREAGRYIASLFPAKTASANSDPDVVWEDRPMMPGFSPVSDDDVIRQILDERT